MLGYSSNLTIYGKAGSYAEQFAEENGIKFVDQDSKIESSSDETIDKNMSLNDGDDKTQ